MYGMGVVMTMIDDVVVVSVDKEGMMAGTMNGSVVVRLENASFVFVGSDRADGTGGILNTIGVVVATA